MTREFVPYPELEEDIERLRATLRHTAHSIAPGVFPVNTLRALDRLLAAFKKPECGARMRGPDAADVWVQRADLGGFIPCICHQPRGHDGPHIPDVPAECWRMPDAGA